MQLKTLSLCFSLLFLCQLVVSASCPHLVLISIDGITQPGASMGVSNARVSLIAQFVSSSMSPFINITNCSNVYIYGLRIDNKITLPAWPVDLWVYTSRIQPIFISGDREKEMCWSTGHTASTSIVRKGRPITLLNTVFSKSPTPIFHSALNDLTGLTSAAFID